MNVIVLTAAAVGMLVVSLFSNNNNSDSDFTSRYAFADPKTVELQSSKFPFHYAPNKCVKAQDIIDVSEVINDLYLKHHIRVFPRNGFLLGIVRHGGFLPIESVDTDIGVIYEDLLRLDGNEGFEMKGFVGDFSIQLNPTRNVWANWKGIEPGTKKRYPFFGAIFSRGKYQMWAYSVYPYHDTGGYFYPRCNAADVNHAAQTKDSLRYNEEGADYRLVDTNEKINASNFKVGDSTQVGTVFDTNFNCFVLTQFYFTTIYVPCDYDVILTSLYGQNWRYVEKRFGGNSRHETKVISEEENQKVLNGGPMPVCAS